MPKTFQKGSIETSENILCLNLRSTIIKDQKNKEVDTERDKCEEGEKLKAELGEEDDLRSSAGQETNIWKEEISETRLLRLAVTITMF